MATHRPGVPPRVGLLLGKAPDRSPVLADVLAELTAAGASPAVHVQDDDGSLPPWADQVDVLALRGLHRRSLEAALALETAGVTCCNPPSATLAVRDRAHVHARLSAAGVAVPTWFPAASWQEVRSNVAEHPVAIKHASGEVGRGTRVLIHTTGTLPAAAPFPGPYVVEAYVPTDEPERKVYRIGDRVTSVPLRPGTGHGAAATPRPLREGPTVPRATEDAPDARASELERVARRAAEALDLSICGFDVIVGPDGPVVVDVNPFPSCRRVSGAATSIADHLLGSATGIPPDGDRTVTRT